MQRNSSIRFPGSALTAKTLLAVFVIVPAAPAAWAQKIYWSEVPSNLIRRANLDGTDVETIVATGDENVPTDIALDLERGKLYWWTFSPPPLPYSFVIHRANLDGSSPEEVIVTPDEEAGTLAVDPVHERIYWWQFRRLYRADYDGSNIEPIVYLGINGVVGGIALDLQDERIYWTVPNQRPPAPPAGIQRANLDGSDVETLVTDRLFGLLLSIALDPSGGKMYWVDGGGRVYRADLDGSMLEILARPSNPRGLALDLIGRRLFWAERESGEGKIVVADLDGSNASDLLDLGPNLAMRMALDLRGLSRHIALDIRPGSCPNPLNVRSRGVVSVAIAGDEALDVSTIDLASLSLERVDGAGSPVPPWGQSVARGATIADVVTPPMEEPCTCGAPGGDGIDDLLLKFSTPEIVDAFALQDEPDGAFIELRITGLLLDGTPIEGSDCIWTRGGERGWRGPPRRQGVRPGQERRIAPPHAERAP